MSSANSGADMSIALFRKVFSPDSFRRVVHGMCYIVDQYTLPTSGPLSVSVPNLSVLGQQPYPHLPHGVVMTPVSLGLMTLYITFYQGEIGKGQMIYELVQEGDPNTVEDKIGKGVILSGIPHEQMEAAQAMARLGTDDLR